MNIPYSTVDKKQMSVGVGGFCVEWETVLK